jgi:hypothetical protein
VVLEAFDQGPAAGPVELGKYIIQSENWFLAADFFYQTQFEDL